MAEAEKIMNISTGDIEKIMNIATGDIEKIMAIEIPASGPAWAGVTGIQFGGIANDNSMSNQIQYRTIQSSADTQDFGNLVAARQNGSGAASNTTRAIMFDGEDNNTDDGEAYSVGVMDYVTVGSTGNAQDFGDLSLGSDGASGQHGGAMSNGTLAFNTDGYVSGTAQGADMSYVTIASTGNATNAGDLDEEGWYQSSTSGDTRGLIWSSWDFSFGYQDFIQYQAFHTSNNASDFGDQGVESWGGAGVSSSLRSVNLHGSTTSGYTDVIEYVTVASTGNGSDFGDATEAEFYKMSGCSDGTRGEWWGGQKPGYSDVIEFITIASTGDATDSANLLATHQTNNSATSGT